MILFADDAREVHVGLVHITASISRNPEWWGEGMVPGESRVWASAVWGEQCLPDSFRFREATSECDEPP